MNSPSDVSVSLDGKSAFVPVEAEDGRFVIRKLRHRTRPPAFLRGRMTFRQAEAIAFARNKKAGIPSSVWWGIGEYIKNADV
jgi:hypothetical protein